MRKGVRYFDNRWNLSNGGIFERITRLPIIHWLPVCLSVSKRWALECLKKSSLNLTFPQNKQRHLELQAAHVQTLELSYLRRQSVFKYTNVRWQFIFAIRIFLAQKLRMHRIISPKSIIWNAIFTFVAFFLNAQKAACTWNDLHLIRLYLL